LPVGVHDDPAEHVTQLPLAQTRFVPQLEPLAALPDATQAETPVEHDVVPALHMSVGWQDLPAAQETQTPPLHT
jgi:hypothetical protein